MTSEPWDFEDPRAEWAKSRLGTVHFAAGNGAAAWCRHVEQHGPLVSVADWVAFQVLQGDESNWQAATCASDREVIEAQWFEVSTFAERFWNLSAAEKQEQYAHVRAHLEDNPVALQQLERYREFLDFDADGTKGEPEDMAELIRELVSYAISGPLGRKKRVMRLSSMWTQEPIRWRIAATQLQNHPRFSQVAPLLLDRLVRIDPEQDGPRQIANRNSFQRRYASIVRRHKLRKLTSKLRPAVPLVLLLIPLYIMVVSTANKDPAAASYKRNPYDRTAAPAPSSDTFLMDPDQAAGLAKLLGNEDAAEYIISVKEKWEEIASTRGSRGLGELEAKLDATSQKVGEFRLLEMFRAWRLKYGDAIAKSRDEEDTSGD